MKTQTSPKSKSEGLRLSNEHWPKMRAIIQAKGRTFLEAWIDRQHKAIVKKSAC